MSSPTYPKQAFGPFFHCSFDHKGAEDLNAQLFLQPSNQQIAPLRRSMVALLSKLPRSIQRGPR